jgi:predicted metal-dependent peptidase
MSGTEMRIFTAILDHEVIDTILRHLARKEAERERDPPERRDLETAV